MSIKLFFPCILILFGCNYKKMPMTICNQSGKSIEKIKAMTFNEESQTPNFSLNTDECKKIKLDMSDITLSDGSFLLAIEANSKLSKNKFGYYTNGWPSERKIEVDIINRDSLTYRFYSKYFY